jgi:hypothetical protein
MRRTERSNAVKMFASLAVAIAMLAPTISHADVLRCKIEGYNEDIFITTPPDTNSSDGQHARIGISPGIANRAIVVADRIGAVAFVELNADDTPIGLLTLQKDLRVIKSRHRPVWQGFRTIPKSGRVYPIALKGAIRSAGHGPRVWPIWLYLFCF